MEFTTITKLLVFALDIFILLFNLFSVHKHWSSYWTTKQPDIEYRNKSQQTFSSGDSLDNAPPTRTGNRKHVNCLYRPATAKKFDSSFRNANGSVAAMGKYTIGDREYKKGNKDKDIRSDRITCVCEMCEKSFK